MFHAKMFVLLIVAILVTTIEGGLYGKFLLLHSQHCVLKEIYCIRLLHSVFISFIVMLIAMIREN